MKKKIIYFMCRVGLYRLARKISPKWAAVWKLEQAFKKAGEAAARLSKILNTTTLTIKTFSKQGQQGLNDHKETNGVRENGGV